MTRINLAALDPQSKDDLPDKETADRELRENVAETADLQYNLWAENRRALLVILQGMDTSGKDGVIRHVFGGLNPQGVRVHAFGRPTPQELDHDFLWRVHQVVPARGEIGIFNRSHYEDVLVARVEGLAAPAAIEQRYAAINQFEHLLSAPPGGYITILKFFLHISPEEQRERLLARLSDPRKNWKVNPGDWAARARWDKYQQAYELVLQRCHTPAAPWHVIPADRKWVRNTLVSRVVLGALRQMAPALPPPAPGLDKLAADLS
jgi:PPK2 family polyphosphate:nucleotide phosphotransferase